jgi:hypothetical protein
MTYSVIFVDTDSFLRFEFERESIPVPYHIEYGTGMDSEASDAVDCSQRGSRSDHTYRIERYKMMPSELPQDEEVCSDSDSDSDSDEGTDSDEESDEDDEERAVNDAEVEEMTAELGALVELGQFDFDIDAESTLPEVLLRTSEGTKTKKATLFSYYETKLQLHNGWRLTDKFPSATRVPELDALLLSRDISRTYASSCWRLFKTSKGYETMNVSNVTEDVLFETLEGKTQGTSETIIDCAICEVEKEDWNLPNFPTFQPDFLPAVLSWCRTNRLPRAALKVQIQIWNKLLANLMTGLSVTTWKQRAYAFELSRITTFRSDYIDGQISVLQRALFPTSQPTDALRLFLLSLYEQMYAQYALTIDRKNDYTYENLYDSVELEEIDQILKGSKPTLYYVAGWLLFRSKKVKKASMRPTLAKFVEFNSVAKSETEALHLPASELDNREMQEGKLARPGTKFFSFCCMLEALYCINYNTILAAKMKASLFETIDACIASSVSLKTQFSDCIPPCLNPSERGHLLEFYKEVLLPVYSKVKASDMLRRIRASKRRSPSEGLALRPSIASNTGKKQKNKAASK